MAELSNRIAEARKKAGLTQAELAERVGSHWITISKLERGKMQLTGGWLTKLSEALSTDFASLLPERPGANREVMLFGTIKSDGTVETSADGYVYSIELPAEGTDDPVSYWMEIEGDALFPYFDERDMIRFVSVDDDLFGSAIGRLCHVSTDDGRELVGFLEQAADDSYSLAIPGRRPVRNFKPKDIGIAVEAKFIVPGLNAPIAG